MTDAQQRAAAKKFAEDWTGKGYEKGESQKFWMALLHHVYGVEEPESFISFEDQVHLDHTSFIDGYIASTKVMIEQKGLGKDLKKPIRQSDGSLLTPFQQAKRYISELPLSKHPRWVITCNFGCFHIYDMEKPHGEPEVLMLEDLPTDYYRLQFLVDTGDEHIRKEMAVSIQAGKLVGMIYDAFLKQYRNPEKPESLKSLNMLCVRLVFCLYAEDAGIFGKHQMFHNYLEGVAIKDAREKLINLFRVLDTKPEDRDPYMNEDLAAFPYVNGGLFSDENIEIPHFTQEIMDLLLRKCSDDFNWSEISPTIFGAVFESTLNPETRRSGGMHYTSIENIHKVIDPLFLDELRKELEEIKAITVNRTLTMRLEAYQKKLANLIFLDPACGSGNFLTETYISLRRLENEVIRCLLDAKMGAKGTAGQIAFGLDGELNPIQVSIQQFYGIEINDFAATVAKTALWIAESQMMKQTEDVIHMPLDFLPLKSYVNIVEGNALRLDWGEVVPKDKLNYIMGNPPFVGARMMEQGSIQKKEVQDIFGQIKDVQDLDYVTCWYKLAAEMMQDTKIETCFVSTNSICQGAQVPILWNVLLNEYGVRINFAYQTFKWGSESNDQAAVHCVIIGFALHDRKNKLLYGSQNIPKVVSNISPYLTEGTDCFVVAVKEAICGNPKMIFGNQPRDGGHFILTEEEHDDILRREPALEKWIHPYMGADEFIKGKKRYCLWLVHASPVEIAKSKILSAKVDAVRTFRLESKAKTTNGYAKVPHCFAQMTQPEGQDYLIVPSVSSERRRYIPIGFLSGEVIASNAVQIVPGATLYHFGVLTSNVHMAWMRTVAGRLKSDYRYSKEIVYNTFPWPTPTDAQKAAIEKTAQAILDARAAYADCSYSDLYGDKMYLFTKLVQAHQANDKAVMQAYGFWGSVKTESDCVARLMEMYAGMVK